MSKLSGKLMLAVGLIAVAVFAIAAVVGTGHVRTHAKATTPAATPAAQSPALSAQQRARVHAQLDALPLAFEANQGQLDPQVKYMARGNGYKLLLTKSRAIITMSASHRNSEVREMMLHKRRGVAGTRALLKKRNFAVEKPSSVALSMNFLDANREAQLLAHQKQGGRVSYFTGRDPKNWQSNIPLFGQVEYRGLYRGVDLTFLGETRQIEFNYIVHPGADPTQIALGLDGAKALSITSDGNLTITMPTGSVQLHKPVAYQDEHGLRRVVDVRFVADRDHKITFGLGGYDRSRDLIIDPTVSYSTYFGGGTSDEAAGIAVDASGNSFIAGATDSTTIPGNSAGAVGFDVFVTEIGPSGTLVFTDIIGGSQDDFPGGIAVDSQGIYIAGTTDSSDFPVTASAVQKAFMGGTISGNNDAFAVKLALNGSAITWATFVAGSESDSALGIAVDSSHNVYVAGETFSTNLGGSIGGVNPLPNGSALNLGSNNLNDDGYIAKINSSGTAYSLVSYLGGSNGDLATGVAVDGSGNIYVVGDTISTDLPFTVGAVQTQCGTDGTCNASSAGPQGDVFVVSIKPTLLGYNYFTYYGGSAVDNAIAITADSGNAFFTGSTSSSDFPTAGTPYQNSLGASGSQNAFIVELNSTGSSATYGTYLGGQGPDIGLAVAVDGSQNVYVTGQTSSSNFPTVNPTQSSLSGTTDAFISVFGLSQNQVLFSTYLGGGGDENQFAAGIGFDSSQNIYVTGDTDSGNGSTGAFPTTSGAIDASYGGGSCVDSIGNTVPCPDAFVTAYSPATAPDFTVSATALSPASVSPGSSATSTVTVTPLNSYGGTVNLTCAVTGTGSPSPQCSLNPTSGNSSTMTVTTTGAAMASRQTSGLLYALWLPIVGLSFAGVRLTCGSAKGRVLSFLLFGAVMTLLFLLPACGGGSGGGGGGGCSGCTPAGSYTVTVTGTDSSNSNLSHAAAVTLTVN